MVDGVVEEIDLQLLQPSDVGVDRDRGPVNVQLEHDPGLLRLGTRRVEHPAHCLAQIEDLAPELDPVASHARRVEQVLQQARHLVHLPPNHLARPAGSRA
jgi:hypothetical protein